MVIEINKDIDRYKETVVMGLTAKQLVFSVVSVVAGGGIVLLLYRYMLWSSIFVTLVAKIYWIVAWRLSELSAFINGASHRCATMPLTKPATSDFWQSNNPIR